MEDKTAKVYVDRNLGKMLGKEEGGLERALLFCSPGTHENKNGLPITSVGFIYDTRTGEILGFEGGLIYGDVSSKPQDWPNMKRGSFELVVSHIREGNGELKAKVLKTHSYLPEDKFPLLNPSAFRALEAAAEKYNRLYGLREE